MRRLSHGSIAFRIGFLAIGDQHCAARCFPAARHASHAGRVAWPGAAAWRRYRQGSALYDFRCHAARRDRSSAHSRRRRIDAKNGRRLLAAVQKQGGWWSAAAWKDRRARHPRRGQQCRRQASARWRSGRSGSLPARLPIFRFISSLSSRSRLATDRSRTCRGCRSCPTCSHRHVVELGGDQSQDRRALGIQQGDLVEIASLVGTLRAAAILSPGIAPDLLAMPVGQGHENFGRLCERSRRKSALDPRAAY